MFSGHFLEIEQTESVTIASDKIQAFRQKWEFSKTSLSKTFLMRPVVKLMECDFLILYEMSVFGNSV